MLALVQRDRANWAKNHCYRPPAHLDEPPAVPTCLPFLKKRILGIERTLKRTAVFWFASTSSFATLTLPSYSSAISSTIGAIRYRDIVGEFAPLSMARRQKVDGLLHHLPVAKNSDVAESRRRHEPATPRSPRDGRSSVLRHFPISFVMKH